MKKSELIAALNAVDGDPEIICQVDQELTGNEDFAWMQGGIRKVSDGVVQLYKHKDSDAIHDDRDDMVDEIINKIDSEDDAEIDAELKKCKHGEPGIILMIGPE